MTIVKTSVTLPEELRKWVDGCAKRSGVSRSRVVSDALEDYLRRLAAKELAQETGAQGAREEPDGREMRDRRAFPVDGEQ